MTPTLALAPSAYPQHVPGYLGIIPLTNEAREFGVQYTTAAMTH